MLKLSFIKEIEKIIGRENVLTGEADRVRITPMMPLLPPVVPGLVVRPTSTEQLGPLVPEVLRGRDSDHYPWFGTNLSGGPSPKVPRLWLS